MIEYLYNNDKANGGIHMKKKIIIPVVSIAILACVGFGGYKIIHSSNNEPKKKVESTAEKTQPTEEPIKTEEATGENVEEAKSIDWSEEDYDTKIIDSENGAVYENIGSKVPEGTATTWDEYKAKMEAGTLTVDDMKQLMSGGKFVKHNEDGSVKRHEDGTVDTSYSKTMVDENGFTYWLLDDGTEVHPGDRDPVSGMIYGGNANDGNYIDSGLTEEELQEFAGL